MKHIIYILTFLSFSFGAVASGQFGGALSWYGYNSLLSTEMCMEGNLIDDGNDAVDRKRRHRRRRKIGPSKKGW